jgi:genome maintenance exonuclease 1
MVELALDTFAYQDCETTNLPGVGRVYMISDEKMYPSITTVLGGTLEPEKAGVLNAWRARVGNKKADQISQAACDRGTNTHLMLERYLRNEDPQLDSFPADHVKIFNSLRLELRKINRVYGQEVVLHSDLFGIAGRCDLIADYQGQMSLVDYKTSSRVKSKDEIGDYWLQCAFYATAHNEMFGTNIEKMVILMGVENHLPLVFRKTIDDELLLKLAERSSEFYAKL